MRKNYTALLLSAVMMTLLFAGCAQTDQNPNPSNTPQQNNELPQTGEPAPNNEPASIEEPTAPSENEPPNAESQPTDAKPVVFMTTDISAAGLQAVYEALGVAPGENSKVAVKVTTGEPPASNYLRQELIGAFVKGLNGTYVECNTAYGGRRAATAMHYEVAAEHGFDPIVLMDDDGEMEIPVAGGLQLKTNTVGTHLADFNFHVVLSHFKGHQMAGYGGALKMLSIGYASFHGKNLIHTAGGNSNRWFGGDQNEFWSRWRTLPRAWSITSKLWTADR
jgi:hypothetical protein